MKNVIKDVTVLSTVLSNLGSTIFAVSQEPIVSDTNKTINHEKLIDTFNNVLDTLNSNLEDSSQQKIDFEKANSKTPSKTIPTTNVKKEIKKESGETPKTGPKEKATETSKVIKPEAAKSTTETPKATDLDKVVITADTAFTEVQKVGLTILRINKGNTVTADTERNIKIIIKSAYAKVHPTHELKDDGESLDKFYLQILLPTLIKQLKEEGINLLTKSGQSKDKVNTTTAAPTPNTPTAPKTPVDEVKATLQAVKNGAPITKVEKKPEVLKPSTEAAATETTSTTSEINIKEIQTPIEFANSLKDSKDVSLVEVLARKVFETHFEADAKKTIVIKEKVYSFKDYIFATLKEIRNITGGPKDSPLVPMVNKVITKTTQRWLKEWTEAAA